MDLEKTSVSDLFEMHVQYKIPAIHERAEGLIADFCEIWPSLDWFSGESYE